MTRALRLSHVDGLFEFYPPDELDGGLELIPRGLVPRVEFEDFFEIGDGERRAEDGELGEGAAVVCLRSTTISACERGQGNDKRDEP